MFYSATSLCCTVRRLDIRQWCPIPRSPPPMMQQTEYTGHATIYAAKIRCYVVVMRVRARVQMCVRKHTVQYFDRCLRCRRQKITAVVGTIDDAEHRVHTRYSISLRPESPRCTCGPTHGTIILSSYVSKSTPPRPSPKLLLVTPEGREKLRSGTIQNVHLCVTIILYCILHVSS